MNQLEMYKCPNFIYLLLLYYRSIIGIHFIYCRNFCIIPKYKSNSFEPKTDRMCQTGEDDDGQSSSIYEFHCSRFPILKWNGQDLIERHFITGRLWRLVQSLHFEMYFWERKGIGQESLGSLLCRCCNRTSLLKGLFIRLPCWYIIVIARISQESRWLCKEMKCMDRSKRPKTLSLISSDHNFTFTKKPRRRRTTDDCHQIWAIGTYIIILQLVR